MAVDLSELLNVNLDTVKRPPVLPPGTYHATISDYKVDRTKPPKLTPFVQFVFRNLAAGDDIDPDQLKDAEGTPIDLAKRTMATRGLSNFYLNPDSMFRIKEFLEALGIDTTGRPLAQALADAKGQSVLLTVTMEQSDDGQQFFNNVTKVTAPPSV